MPGSGEHNLTKTTHMDFDPVEADPVPAAGPAPPVSNVKFRYIIVPEDDIKPHIVHGSGTMNDKNFYCESKYNLLGLSAVELSHTYLETIRPALGRSFEEVSRDEFYYGTSHFGEIRDTVKIAKTDTDAVRDYTLHFPEDTFKTPTDFTDTMKTHTLSFMKKFGKEIIENEYSKKLKYIRKVSELEAATWEIQKHEAREFLTYGENDPGHVTPFLDYIATERGFDKTTLANKILSKAEEYQDKLSTTLVESQKLLKLVEGCTTVNALNVIFEDYFGIMMSTDQAIEEGRADDGKNDDGSIDYNKKGLRMAWFNTDTNEKTTKDDPKAQLLPDVINPYLGNKLNF